MKLSLCCISNILAEQGIKFRTMTYKSYSSKSKEESQEKLSEIIQNNFYTTRQIIHHCKNSGIQGYRLSSDLTPVLNHPEVNLKMESLQNLEEQIRDDIKTSFNDQQNLKSHLHGIDDEVTSLKSSLQNKLSEFSVDNSFLLEEVAKLKQQAEKPVFSGWKAVIYRILQAI